MESATERAPPPSLNGRSLLGSGGAPTREEVKDEWGRWLTESFEPFDWWTTLTFDPKRGPSGVDGHTAVGWALSDRYWREWLSEVTGDDGSTGLVASRSWWIRGREPNPWRYGTHFHALIGGVENLNRTAAWRAWFFRHGMARIEPYDPRKGAGWYVAKYVVKELGDIRFSDNFGLHRKGL